MNGKIARDERESVDRHLQDCAFCRQDLTDAQSWFSEHPEPIQPPTWRRFIPWLK